MSQSEDPAIDDTNKSADTAAPFNIAQKQFDDLCAQFYHSWFRYHPEKAVDVGVYEYADQLTSYEHDDIGALLVLDQKMLSALDELNVTRLDEGRQVDFRIIQGTADTVDGAGQFLQLFFKYFTRHKHTGGQRNSTGQR